MVDDFVRRYNEDTGSKATPAQAYDDARMSLRTTFDAVTHALLTTKMSNEKGQSLGHRYGGCDDRQFRTAVSFHENAAARGTAYTIWTGIGALGAFLVGIVVLSEPMNLLRAAAVLIVSGLILMKVAAG